MRTAAYLDGYLCKVAEEGEPDLPGGQWYKGLVPHLPFHQAGRAQALYEAMGKESPFTIKHPYLATLPYALGGNVIGSLAGGAIGASHSEPYLGKLVGGIAGIYLGSTLALIRRQAEVKGAAKEYAAEGGSEENIYNALEETAGKNRLAGGLKGAFTGAYDYGRTAQLQNLLANKGKVKSGSVFGLSSLIGAPATLPLNIGGGVQSISEARNAVKERKK